MHVIKVDFNKEGDDFLIVGPFTRPEHADNYKRMVATSRWPNAVKMQEIKVIEADMVLVKGRSK